MTTKQAFVEEHVSRLKSCSAKLSTRLGCNCNARNTYETRQRTTPANYIAKRCIQAQQRIRRIQEPRLPSLMDRRSRVEYRLLDGHGGSGLADHYADRQPRLARRRSPCQLAALPFCAPVRWRHRRPRQPRGAAQSHPNVLDVDDLPARRPDL